MRRVASLAIIFLLVAGFAASVVASDQEIVEVRLAKILDNYAVKTSFGNVYFNIGDVHRLVDSAAKLRPFKLGTFTTDTGQTVKIGVIAYTAGVAKLAVKKL
jgi:hypothetical protein